MLGTPGGLHGLMQVVEIAVVLAVFVLVRAKSPSALDRSTAWKLGVAWVLFVTAEFWALGPASFVHVNDEGEGVVPMLLYLAKHHDGGLFAHGLLGGVDAETMLMVGMTPVSLETWLFSALPLWAALAVHKVLIVGLSTSGTYLLARRGGGADRWTALAAAMAVSVAHRYVTTGSLHAGLVGYAIIPLALYLLVYRLDRSWYWAGAAGTAAAVAAASIPTHSTAALGLALMVVWAVERFPRPGRFCAALGLMIVLVIANWAEKLYAFMVVGAASYRGTEVNFSASAMDLSALLGKYFTDRSPEAVPALLVILAMLYLKRRERFGPTLLMLGVVIAVGPLLIQVPWQATPLPVLKAFDFFYLVYGLPALMALAAAWTTTKQAQRVSFTASVLLALAMGSAAALKVFHGAQWLGRGGQSIYAGYPNLAQRDWVPDDTPFRTATVPYRLDPNTTAAYGLDSFDGFVNVYPRELGFFWRDYMPKGRVVVGNGLLYIAHHDTMDFLCCKAYDAEKILNLDALRLGNVSFLVSVLPLAGGGLQLVSGPAPGTTPPRRSDSMSDKVLGFLKLQFVHENAYVYRLPGALPRAFAAHRIEVSDNFDLETALSRVAFTRDAGTLGGVRDLPGGRVVAASVPGGYDIDVDMPEGGVVVLNAVWTPFWRATLDGARTDVIQVNAIHMAVRVPLGARELRFRYDRPTLGEYLGASTSR